MTIGVAISTQGRPTLIDTLTSIHEQDTVIGDRTIVVFDGPSQGVDIEDMRDMFPWVDFFERPADPGAWGHTHTNWSFDQLRGTVDIITAQDDDDIFAPRAYEMMRKRFAANPGHLHMSRVYNHAWGLLWRNQDWDEPLAPSQPRLEGNFAHDGHSIWLPGRAPVLPKIGRLYNGDQEYVQAARLLFWEKVVWCPEITTITRPAFSLGWKLAYKEVRTTVQVETLRVLRNECRHGFTGFTGVIDQHQQRTWWDNNKHAVRAFLLEDGPEAVGFVVIRPYHEGGTLDGEITATIGVGKKHRRRGYGREIAQFAVLAAQGPLKGEAYADNPVLPLDYEAGWVKTGERDNLVELECAWPPKYLMTKN